MSGCGGSSGGGLTRMGCHQYCQQAGGQMGPGGSGANVKILTSGSVGASAEGLVPIKVRCLISSRCSGVLVLIGNEWVPPRPGPRRPYEWELGRSDLILAGHQTATLGVPLYPATRVYLKRRGSLKLYTDAEFPVGPDMPDQHVSGANLVLTAG